VKAIADTGFIVAFGSRGDDHHAWAVDIAKNITEPLITCEAVLAEAAFRLGSSSYVLSLVRLVRNEMFRLGFDLTRNLEQLAELAKRYEDRKQI
jgi:predicted nucleic acid-binding protein